MRLLRNSVVQMKVVDQGFQCDTGDCVNVAICLEVQIHATPYLCAVILFMFFRNC